MVTARERTLAAKGKPDSKATPLQISLLGHDVVLDPFSLTIAEKQTWRRYIADLGGETADEADYMMCLSVVMIQRRNDSLTWDEAKNRITWQMMLDAIAAGGPAEDNHPEG